MCGADADVPYQMLLDVNSLSKDKLEVFVPWGERPLKYTVNLTGSDVATKESDHTYEAITEAQHWYWAENEFEQEQFVNLEYSAVAGGVVNYSDIPNTLSSPDCNACSEPVFCGILDGKTPEGISCNQAMREAENSCTCGCPGHSGNVKETFTGQWERVYYRMTIPDKSHCETKYDIFLPGKTANMTSRDWEIVNVQGKYS